MTTQSGWAQVENGSVLWVSDEQTPYWPIGVTMPSALMDLFGSGIATAQQMAPFGVLPLYEDTPVVAKRFVQSSTASYRVSSDRVTRALAVTHIPLIDAKVEATAKVNAWRLARETSGFAYAGKTWQSDERSAMRIIGAVTYAENAAQYSQTWTAADNSTMTLDKQGIRELFEALHQHIASVFAAAKTVKDRISAAKSVEEIDQALSGLN